MTHRYRIIDGVGSGYLLIDMTTGQCAGFFKTRYAATKARKAMHS